MAGSGFTDGGVRPWVGKASTPREASEYLDSLGIKGIKYLDGGSRGEGEGTRNLVVFNDKNIQRVYSEVGADKQKLRFSKIEQVVQRTPELRKTQAAVNTFLKNKPLAQEWLGRKLKTGSMGLQFGHTFAANASKIVPAAKGYFDAVGRKMVERARAEEQVVRIIRDANDTLTQPQRDQVNQFLLDSTYAQAWGYQPAWKQEKVTIDPAMKQRWDALSKDQQGVVSRVFEEGEKSFHATEAAINDNLPADQKIKRTQLEGPYAPLKRLGDYATVAKSAEFMRQESLAEEGDAAAKKWVAKNETDPKHKYVAFHDSEWAAMKDRDNIQTANPDMTVTAAQAEVQARQLGEMQFQVYKRLEEMIGHSDLGGKEQTRALKNVAQQLYVQSLNRQHAMHSSQRRRGIAGANEDMLRAFAVQGRANAAMIASLKTTADLQKTLQLARAQARGSEQGKAIVNELIKRHIAMIQHKETPIQNAFMALNSVEFLLTSPAYYLQNMTQPFMMSLPTMAGPHGMAKAQAALFHAYGETLKLVSLFKQDALHLDEIDQLKGNIGQERAAMQEIMDRNHMDLGINTDLGDLGNFPVLAEVMRKLRGLARNVEIVNRLSTALTAYRLQYSAELSKGKTAAEAHAAATEYADTIIVDTHGDYNGSNAPRFMMQGNSSMPVKAIMQFKKFQLIQLALIAKLGKAAFMGASKEERAVAWASLRWILATHGAFTGMMGIPFAWPLAWMLAAMFGDDGEDKEATYRRWIGDHTWAQLLLHGAPAAAGMDVSKRIGMASILNPMPYANEGKGLKETLTNYLIAGLGPTASTAQKFAGGIDTINKGDYWKGLEQMIPNGLSNAMKGYRFATQGVTTTKGDLVLSPDEVGFFDGMFQAAGLPTTLLTDRTWKAGVVHDTEQHFMGQVDSIKHEYLQAHKDGDTDEMATLRQKWMEVQQARADAGFKRQPMSVLLKSPQEQMKRERRSVDGLEYTKQNKGFVTRVSAL